jgi:hypothetical protein
MSNGKLSNRRASRRASFTSIGESSKPPAPKATPVSAGLRPLITARMRSSRSNAPSRTVKAVPVVHCVRTPRATHDAPSPCVVCSNIKRYNVPERVPRPRSSKRSTRGALGWKAPFRKRVRAMGLRRSRYIGQERTHLQHLATAAAMNIVRLMRWLDGEPLAQTRISAFVQLLRPVA